MNFLDNLQSHRGGLIRLKTQLYWYNSGLWDEGQELCLVLDTAPAMSTVGRTAAARTYNAGIHGALNGPGADHRTQMVAKSRSVCLLINGSAQWVLVVEADVELL
jgi:hypothetical protein